MYDPIEQQEPTQPAGQPNDPQQGDQTSAAPNAEPHQPEPQNEGEPKEPKPEPTPAEKEAKALKRRIDRLTRGKYQSEAQIQQLQAELAQYRAQQVQQPGGEGHQPIHQPQQQHQPDLRQQAQEVLRMERINARCDDVVDAGEAAYPDFKAKVVELSHELPLFGQGGAPQPILEAILEADNPAALIYHLGSDPDLAAELADLSPRQQMRRLMKIEAQLSADPTKQPSASAQQPPRDLSKAPPPVNPNRAASGSPSKDPAAMTDAEWWASQRKSQA